MRVILFLLSLLALSCSSDDSVSEGPVGAKGKRKGKSKTVDKDEPVDLGNGLKIVELRIEARNPTTNGVLNLRKQICQADDISSSGKCIKKSALQGRNQWMKNGSPIAGQLGSALMGDHFKKGDKISVVLTFPKAEGVQRKEHTSNEITIENTAPEIDPERNQDIYAARLSALIKEGRPFPIRAKDADGDELEYRISGAPNGMSIVKKEKYRAELRYETSTKIVPGEYKIQVIADDKEDHHVWPMTITLWATGEIEAEEEEEFVDEDADDAAERREKDDEPIEGLIGGDEPDLEWQDKSIEGLEGDDEPDLEWEDDSIEGLEEGD